MIESIILIRSQLNQVFKEIINICTKAKVEFMASIWTESLLDDFDDHLKRYKIGSGDLTNYPLIKLMAERSKPIILSTGLSNINEVDSTVKYIRSINNFYNNPDNLTVMQCTSVILPIGRGQSKCYRW